MYALVLFKQGAQPETPEVSREHEAFIDSLIHREQILLGGSWSLPAGPFLAAYLLRCGSLDEARTIVSADPFFRYAVYQAEIVEWELVGIDPKAIEPGVVLTSDDVEEGSRP